jgi:NAD(P)-dependent dehydrogenase (short-subunit alcohol dehydrogenase family)
MANGHPARRLSGGITMNIEGRTILVTGASRGIGKALVDEALRRGAGCVYAGTRGPLVHDDPRVVPVALDVTNSDQIAPAARQIGELDVLVNNAGIVLFDDLSDRSVLEQHLAVNLFGPYEVTLALLPALARSHGAIVNNASMMALAPFR